MGGEFERARFIYPAILILGWMGGWYGTQMGADPSEVPVILPLQLLRPMFWRFLANTQPNLHNLRGFSGTSTFSWTCW